MVFDYIKNFVLSTKFAFLCPWSLASELRLRDTVDVVDLLPVLLSWMLVRVQIHVTLQWESVQSTHGRNGEKKYQDLLVNIKKHCCEYISAKLKSWNHTCLFQSYRSGYKMMRSNEIKQRKYEKAI